MTQQEIRATSRRRFLQYCAASPLLASGALAAHGMPLIRLNEVADRNNSI